MAGRRNSYLALSARQAHAALALLIQEGKLKASEVMKALQRRDGLVKALRASLAALGVRRREGCKAVQEQPVSHWPNGEGGQAPSEAKEAENLSGHSEDVPPSGEVSLRHATSLDGAAGEGQGDEGEVGVRKAIAAAKGDGEVGSRASPVQVTCFFESSLPAARSI